MRIKRNALLFAALLLAACCLAFPPLSGAGDKPDMPPGLAETIDGAISDLKKGRHADFIKTYADPKDLEELLQKASLDEVAALFADGKADKLLDVLNQARDAVPKYNPDKRTATFENPGRDLIFVEIDGRWYIKN